MTQTQKISFVGVNYVKEFPELEDLMRRVKPGMRVGLAISEKMLELFKQGENPKLPQYFPSNESYQFVKQMIEGLKKKGAEPVALVDEELVKKHKIELLKLEKKLTEKKNWIIYDLDFGGGSSKSPQDRLKELTKTMEEEINRKLFIDSMSMLKKAIEEKVHVAILEKGAVKNIRNTTSEKAPFKFEFL